TVQSFFFSPKDPVGGWILGAGPVLLLPTGTEPALRSEQLGLGPTGVALQQRGGWTYGALFNHLWGVTDEDDNARVDATFLQPFLTYTWPTATTLALNAEATYDWEADDLTLPINLGVSQVLQLGGQPLSVQLGGRYYAHAPSAGPEWGVRLTLTLLFPK
ncbi:MAG: transporter, partial [Myxococcota bacterium]|nr:transporter [Myxococcota bacterium]